MRFLTRKLGLLSFKYCMNTDFPGVPQFLKNIIFPLLVRPKMLQNSKVSSFKQIFLKTVKFAKVFSF